MAHAAFSWLLHHLSLWVKTWNLTTLLAVWGAFLSSITAIWSFRKDLRDKAEIRIRASLRCFGARDGDGKPYMAKPSMNIEGMGDKLYVVVTITNVGRRKIRLTGWGGKFRNPVNGKDGFTVGARTLPHTFDEQEQIDEWADLDKHFVEGNVSQLYTWDVSGNNWYVSRSDMKKLQKDIKEFAGEPYAPDPQLRMP